MILLLGGQIRNFGVCSGCSAARLAHLPGGQGVASSNLVTPTNAKRLSGILGAVFLYEIISDVTLKGIYNS